MAGLYGRTNLTLWLVVKRKGRKEGEKWKCCSDVGASATRSGEPLWPDKPGISCCEYLRGGRTKDCGRSRRLPKPVMASLYGWTRLVLVQVSKDMGRKEVDLISQKAINQISQKHLAAHASPVYI